MIVGGEEFRSNGEHVEVKVEGQRVGVYIDGTLVYIFAAANGFKDTVFSAKIEKDNEHMAGQTKEELAECARNFALAEYEWLKNLSVIEAMESGYDIASHGDDVYVNLMREICQRVIPDYFDWHIVLSVGYRDPQIVIEL